MILTMLVITTLSAQVRLGDNAALRYWSAFAQMQDSTVTDEQAKELNRILDGTAPYSDLKYRDFVQRNRNAVETLARGAGMPQCDWGLEYALGAEAPIDYVRKALALGRLNVLDAFHRLQTGDRNGAIRTLASGLRFSRDVAEGGPLFAAVAAKTLLVSHLRAVDFAAHVQPLSATEKSTLSKAIAGEIDWQAAMRREFEVLRHSGTPTPAALTQLYQDALRDASLLPKLQQAISAQPFANRIPNPQRVLDAQQDLRQARALLQTR